MKAGRLLSALSVAVALSIPIVIAIRSGIRPASLVGFGAAGVHAAAFLLWFIELLARSARAALIASGIGVKLRFRDAVLAHASGDAAGAVTPSRAGADPAKMLSFRRSGLDFGRSGAIVLGESVSEAIALILIIASLVLFSARGGAVALGAIPYIATTLSFVILALGAGHWLNSPKVRGFASRLSPIRRRKIRRTILRFLCSARMFAGISPALAITIVITALLHILARITLLPVLATPLQHNATAGELMAWSLMLLYAGALVPAPSGGGTIEIGFAAAMNHVLGPAQLPAILLWWRIYTFYIGALVGATAIFIQSRRAVTP